MTGPDSTSSGSDSPQPDNPVPGPAATTSSSRGGLAGLRVCSFESRKQSEIRLLLEKQGATATVVASMREIPLSQNPQAFAFAERLFSGKIDLLILLTGVGTRALAETIATRCPLPDFLDALRKVPILVRGPKPAAVLREWKVPFEYQVSEPNTWRELLQLVDREINLSGRNVAVQEYGQSNNQLLDGLAARGANVLPVPVYRWELPEDVQPLQAAIATTLAGGFDILMFTSANQINNILEVADRDNCRDEWMAAARKCAIASIGPTASEHLREMGLPPDIEPEHPKMGHLVLSTAEHARLVLELKRAH